MADIDVTEQTPGTYRVRVREDDGSSSTHSVTVPDGYLDEIGLGDVAPATVVDESIKFLLGREPKESILSSFRLPQIADFFPDYPERVRETLA